MDALTVATEIVTAGGELAAARQDGVSERTQGDVRSLAGAVVTDVDLAVERYVDETLAARCPDDGLVGEEYANRRGTSPRTWVVDPVDGTLNYARRLGPWSVVLSAWTGDELGLVARPGRQHHRPRAEPPRVVEGAVHGVDDPGAGAGPAPVRVLLADQAVVRAAGSQRLVDVPLDRQVDVGDEGRRRGSARRP